MQFTEELTFYARPSGLKQIMTDPKGKTPQQKYDDCCAKLDAAKTKWDAVLPAKQSLVSNQKLLKTIRTLEQQKLELEGKKDDIMLSQTCITYMENWIREHYFGRKKMIKTKGMQKGVEKEFEAIFFHNKVVGTKYQKCDLELQNEYMIGHRDIDGGDHVADTKVCQGFSTFPLLDQEVEDEYWWQGQGYMAFEPKHEYALIIKVLLNSPEWQIKQLIKYSYFQLLDKYPDDPQLLEEEHQEEIKQIFNEHVFDRSLEIDGYKIPEEQVIPPTARIHVFRIERDEEAIAKIQPRVEACRKYLHNWYVNYISKMQTANSHVR